VLTFAAVAFVAAIVLLLAVTRKDWRD